MNGWRLATPLGGGMTNDAERAERFLAENPAIEAVEAFIVDVNGIARGKRIPRRRVAEILTKGVAMPRSTYALDIWGLDIEGAGLALGTGDPDGISMPVWETVAPVTWLSRPIAQVMLGMRDSDGSPFYADPRNVLADILARFTARGLTPVVATELEFYLIDPMPTAAAPLRPPFTGDSDWRRRQPQVYAIAELNDYDPIFADIAAACALQNVPADTALRENGPGQYEINLTHVPDALMAADHAVLLKRIIRGVARKHGLDATFMAKPYGDRSGSGLHVHVSLLDGEGRNVFVGEGEQPQDILLHAVAGLIGAMPDSMAIFAPHANSFRRLRPGSHAPSYASWGFDNRAAAVRVITAPKIATRIEHRVAGADANPYLVLAAILGGMLDGIETQRRAPPPLSGDAHTEAMEQLPTNWDSAVARFAESSFAESCLGARYKNLYRCCKVQELAKFRLRVTDVEIDAYARTV